MADERDPWLDQDTAERLLRGDLVGTTGAHAAAAARAVSALRALARVAPANTPRSPARAAAVPGETRGEAAALAAFRNTTRRPPHDTAPAPGDTAAPGPDASGPDASGPDGAGPDAFGPDGAGPDGARRALGNLAVRGGGGGGGDPARENRAARGTGMPAVGDAPDPVDVAARGVGTPGAWDGGARPRRGVATVRSVRVRGRAGKPRGRGVRPVPVGAGRAENGGQGRGARPRVGFAALLVGCFVGSAALAVGSGVFVVPAPAGSDQLPRSPAAVTGEPLPSATGHAGGAEPAPGLSPGTLPGGAESAAPGPWRTVGRELLALGGARTAVIGTPTSRAPAAGVWSAPQAGGTSSAWYAAAVDACEHLRDGTLDARHKAQLFRAARGAGAAASFCDGLLDVRTRDSGGSSASAGDPSPSRGGGFGAYDPGGSGRPDSPPSGGSSGPAGPGSTSPSSEPPTSSDPSDAPSSEPAGPPASSAPGTPDGPSVPKRPSTPADSANSAAPTAPTAPAGTKPAPPQGAPSAVARPSAVPAAARDAARDAARGGDPGGDRDAAEDARPR
ncbi:hypothetical protein [Streptomyces tremellae]|uniref:Uncharacterized protein n=1 Tax=Streptomyces tremellae TaxID=1124239 RepID=A0ABP7FT26_9ACTN